MGETCCRKGERFPSLFSPLRIGNIRLKNRIIAAPTSPSMITTQGHFTPEMIAYLEEKAMGGAGVVTYGEAIVHSATGKSHNKQLQLDSYGVKQGMAEAARAIHNAGAYANIQLSHGGMYGGLASVGGDLRTQRYHDAGRACEVHAKRNNHGDCKSLRYRGKAVQRLRL